MRSASFSPDGTRVATAGEDGTARVWDAKTGAAVAELRGHAGTVWSASFSPDGSRVVTSGEDGTTQVWDAHTGKEIIGSTPLGVHFRSTLSPDGRSLLHVIGIDTVRIVPTAPDAEEVADRRYLTRPRPDLHAEEAARLAKDDPFAAAMQRSFEHRARGVLAFEAGDFDRAQIHFLTAVVLNPLAPKVPPVDRDADTPGLRAEFYQGTNFERLLTTRIDREINWDGQASSPDPKVPVDKFSVRWTGQLRAPAPGRYGLAFFADDGVRVWLDDKLVIDAWKSPRRETHRCEVELSDRPHRIRIEYFEDSGWAAHRFSWVPPGKTQPVVVPSSCLRPVGPPRTSRRPRAR